MYFKKDDQVKVIAGDLKDASVVQTVIKVLKTGYVNLKGVFGMTSKKKTYPLKIHRSNLKKA